MDNEDFNLLIEKNNKKFYIVKKVIDEWNPYGLLYSAPADEFDSESSLISSKISSDNSIEQIANIVSQVFTKAFNPDKITVQDCFKVAEQIKQNLTEDLL